MNFNKPMVELVMKPECVGSVWWLNVKLGPGSERWQQLKFLKAPELEPPPVPQQGRS